MHGSVSFLVLACAFLVFHVGALFFLVFAWVFRVFRVFRVFSLLAGHRKNPVTMVVCVVGGWIACCLPTTTY